MSYGNPEYKKAKLKRRAGIMDTHETHTKKIWIVVGGEYTQETPQTFIPHKNFNIGFESEEEANKLLNAIRIERIHQKTKGDTKIQKHPEHGQHFNQNGELKPETHQNNKIIEKLFQQYAKQHFASISQTNVYKKAKSLPPFKKLLQSNKSTLQQNPK